MSRLLGLLFLLFGTIVVASSPKAEEAMDSYRSEIEVYGNVQFLLRINKDEKLGIKIHEGDGEHCTINEAQSRAIVRDVLTQHDRLGSEEQIHHFRMDVDHFSAIDERKHCLVSYEVYLTQNILEEPEFEKILKDDFGYEYENSKPLLKINGIMHVEEEMLDNAFKKELRDVTTHLMSALAHLQEKVRREMPR